MSKDDFEELENWTVSDTFSHTVQKRSEPSPGGSRDTESDLLSENATDKKSPLIWMFAFISAAFIGLIGYLIYNNFNDDNVNVASGSESQLDENDDLDSQSSSDVGENVGVVESEKAALSTETGDQRDPSRPKMLVASFTPDRQLIVRGNVPNEIFYKNMTIQFEGVAAAAGYELVNEWIINPDEGIPDSIVGNYEQTAIFESGSSEVDPDQIINLAPSYLALAQFDVVTANIIGHTDSKGSTEFNEALSLRRAQAVRDFFLSPQAADIFVPAELRQQRCLTPEELTINPSQIEVVGAGETETEADEVENSADRRVEIRYENTLELDAMLEENPAFMAPRTC